MRCNKDLCFLVLHLKLCVLAIDPGTSTIMHRDSTRTGSDRYIAGRNLAAVDHNLATAARNPAAAARNRATLAWIRPSPSSRAASAVARREQQGNFDPVLLSPVLLPILLPSCAAAACFSTVACFAAAWHRLPFPDTLSRE
jgi:hypothetical protein